VGSFVHWFCFLVYVGTHNTLLINHKLVFSLAHLSELVLMYI
jgi:hypothetical protein